MINFFHHIQQVVGTKWIFKTVLLNMNQKTKNKQKKCRILKAAFIFSDCLHSALDVSIVWLCLWERNHSLFLRHRKNHYLTNMNTRKYATHNITYAIHYTHSYITPFRVHFNQYGGKLAEKKWLY